MFICGISFQIVSFTAMTVWKTIPRERSLNSNPIPTCVTANGFHSWKKDASKPSTGDVPIIVETGDGLAGKNLGLLVLIFRNTDGDRAFHKIGSYVGDRVIHKLAATDFQGVAGHRALYSLINSAVEQKCPFQATQQQTAPL